MSGLIEKDFRLLLQRKQVMLMFAVLAVFMGVSGSPLMTVSYLTLISSGLTLGTISYDEFDNGYPFLMTLPFERKTYAAEKYVFCFIGAFASWVVGVIAMCVISAVQGSMAEVPALIGISTVFIPLSVVFCSLMIPLQIKYGSEKSRLVLYIILGIIALTIGAVAALGAGDTAVSVIELLGSVNPLAAVIGVWAVCGALCFLSYLWCRKILENKEF